MYYSVDRIEGNVAVLIGDDDQRLTLPVDALHSGVKEGDCLLLADGGYRFDAAETAKRRADNAALQNDLFQ